MGFWVRSTLYENKRARDSSLMKQTIHLDLLVCFVLIYRLISWNVCLSARNFDGLWENAIEFRKKKQIKKESFKFRLVLKSLNFITSRVLFMSIGHIFNSNWIFIPNLKLDESTHKTIPIWFDETIFYIHRAISDAAWYYLPCLSAPLFLHIASNQIDKSLRQATKMPVDVIKRWRSEYKTDAHLLWLRQRLHFFCCVLFSFASSH